MQKKNVWAIIILIVIVVAAGGYAIYHNHKSTKTPTSTTATTTSTSADVNKPVTVNNSVVITKSNSSIGSYLAGPSDKALYTDGSGSAGVSNCTGSCLSAWPIYQDKGATTGLPENVGTIKRSDNGEIQYTYNGMPLYYFASDSAGQVTGNGIAGFYVAKP
jgi:predicted lipoprotein with Yx(FWY)xxD motif